MYCIYKSQVSFFYEWLEEHYIQLLKASIRRELGPQAKLVYSIIVEKPKANVVPQKVQAPKKQAPVKTRPVQATPVQSQVETTVANPFVLPGLGRVNVESQLNRNYSFDNFYRRGF